MKVGNRIDTLRLHIAIKTPQTGKTSITAFCIDRKDRQIIRRINKQRGYRFFRKQGKSNTGIGTTDLIYNRNSHSNIAERRKTKYGHMTIRQRRVWIGWKIFHEKKFRTQNCPGQTKHIRNTSGEIDSSSACPGKHRQNDGHFRWYVSLLMVYHIIM